MAAPPRAGEHGRPTWAARTCPLQPGPTSTGRGGPRPHRHPPPAPTPAPRGTLGFGSSALRRPAGTSRDLQGPGIRAPGCTAHAHSATPSRRTAAHTRHPYGNRYTAPPAPQKRLPDIIQARKRSSDGAHPTGPTPFREHTNRLGHAQLHRAEKTQAPPHPDTHAHSHARRKPRSQRARAHSRTPRAPAAGPALPAPAQDAVRRLSELKFGAARSTRAGAGRWLGRGRRGRERLVRSAGLGAPAADAPALRSSPPRRTKGSRAAWEPAR